MIRFRDLGVAADRVGISSKSRELGMQRSNSKPPPSLSLGNELNNCSWKSDGQQSTSLKQSFFSPRLADSNIFLAPRVVGTLLASTDERQTNLCVQVSFFWRFTLFGGHVVAGLFPWNNRLCSSRIDKPSCLVLLRLAMAFRYACPSRDHARI